MVKEHRVVVTGMGVLAPNGSGLKAFWRSLVRGQSGIGPITLFDPTGFRTRIAGEVKEFDPLDYMPAQWKPRRMARHTQLAFAATQMALRNANFTPSLKNRGAVLPVCIGVSTSALDVIERGFHELQDRGPRRVNSGVVSNCQPQAAAHLIAENSRRRTAGYNDFLGLSFSRCDRIRSQDRPWRAEARSRAEPTPR
jgi:3-oxoacyl-[acyl-carrier-protein] synthase II